MSIGIKVKKGLDIHLAGGIPADAKETECRCATVAIVPDDFTGLIPKMELREGDTVKSGQPLFHSKLDERLKITSPVSGTVKAVVRGERRKILRVVVEAGAGEAVRFDVKGSLSDKTSAREALLASGLWAMLRQRPYDIVPTADARFRDIFVSGFDSAPLAWNKSSYSKEDIKALEAGVKLLSLLAEGKVYVSRRPDSALPDLAGAEMLDITGPHPASNVGTAIAAVKPVNKGETVGCLDIETLRRIGNLALTGTVDFSTTVAVTGSEVKNPSLVTTLVGAEMSVLLKDNLADDGRNKRIISGNVLTGTAVPADGYLRFPYRQVTVIPEGDDVAEFMGWASFSPKKQSTSPTFPGHFLSHKLFKPDARLLGGRRAMIMSGEYDKVFPMDILPEYLIKAILAKDIDRMEQLGIYEVAPEDFALAEYADTSKLELQKIVREGLDYLRKELS